MDKRLITSVSCIDIPSNNRASLRRDLRIANFIVKKRNLTIAKSYRLGTLWEILDPLFISMVYLFVFTVIRHNPNTGSIIIGITVFQGLRKNLIYGACSNLDFSAGMVIERVRSRAIVFSEIWYVTQSSIKLSIGAVCVVLFLGTSYWAIILIPLGCFTNGLIWYSFGRLVSPIVLRINDFKNILTYFAMMMFFFSPVLYSLDATSGIHRDINLLNPFVYVVEPLRDILFNVDSIDLLNYTFAIIITPVIILCIFYSLYSIDKQRWKWSTWS